MIQKNFTFFLITFILCTLGLSFVYGQIKSSISLSTSNISSVSINEVEKQTVIYKEKQSEINKTIVEIDQSKNQIKAIQAQKQELENELSSLQIQSKVFQKQLSETKNSDANESNGKNIQTSLIKNESFNLSQTELLKKLNDNYIIQENIKAKIEEKSTLILEFQSTVSILEKTLDLKKSELIDQLNNIINIGLLLASNYAIYLLILIILWVVYRVIISLVSKDIKNQPIKEGSINVVKIVWIGLSILVIFYGFAGQFSYILASLGFVSAALVFALQNFVASIFVFVIITFTKIIKVGDIVKIGPDFENYNGEVIKIGRFYTFIREISPQNQEQLGRTVSVPNSFLLSHPVINFTVRNKILWQNLKVVVDGDSDQIIAKQILQKVLTTRFDWVKNRKQQYLDLDADVTEIIPKISMSLEDRGVAYTLHFPCHFQKYNEIYDQLLTEILIEFKNENIKLAFAS
jgi:small-conductance mechanosensitive channel